MYSRALRKAVLHFDKVYLKKGGLGMHSNYRGIIFRVPHGYEDRFREDFQNDLERRGFSATITHVDDVSFAVHVTLEEQPPVYEASLWFRNCLRNTAHCSAANE